MHDKECSSYLIELGFLWLVLYQDLLESEQENWRACSAKYMAMTKRIKQRLEAHYDKYSSSLSSPVVRKYMGGALHKQGAAAEKAHSVLPPFRPLMEEARKKGPQMRIAGFRLVHLGTGGPCDFKHLYTFNTKDTTYQIYPRN